MSSVRRCSRTACALPAVATLTYVYADRAAVVGPLAVQAEPHCYDLCEDHAQGLTAPRGWEVVRHQRDSAELARSRSSDDLEALADAVREAARPTHGLGGDGHDAGAGHDGGTGRRGHLRALPTPG
ncbi:MAG: DUF3499 domain-containing protein [Mycobacteriales bacterium]